PRFSWAATCARRLERQGLAVPWTGAHPADVVAAMCGAHAQVLTAAELSIGLRLAGGTRAGVREALWTARSLVKTYGPRGTVHLLPTRDLPLWIGALAAVPPTRNLFGKDALLTPEQAEEIVAAIAAILEEGELTTDELTAALVDRVGSWAGDPVMEAFQGAWPRWRMVQAEAGLGGALCFGPNRGRKVTFTSPRRWLPGFRPADGPAALAEVARRYLHTYGPATPQQFARWLAAPRGWATELFASLAAELEQVELEGTPAWVLSGDTALPGAPPEGVRLLPYFDAYVVGSHPRELLFPGPAAERAQAGGGAGNFQVLLVAGTVAGIWHQRRSGRKIDVTVEPFWPLTAAQRDELDRQVRRIGEFMEGEARWTIGAVSTGPHA
ncbi:MAG TPA: winged helix DNA-binding domain-containing protein, partial [Anaerolineae bacterium]|nr:winged helix DNA-binding domain-containing protein [Anaerolineae bacterium]